MVRPRRTETDSFGPIEVPGDSYWGAQTERSIGNFPFGERERMPAEIVHALGYVKQAAARVNARIGGLDADLAEAIQQAAAEVARGDLDGQFPLVIWQTGSGTQSNMNANEVIAGRANEQLTGHQGRQGRRSTPTIMSTRASRRTTASRPRCTSPRRSRCRKRLLPALKLIHARLDEQARALRPHRQDRPHPFAGRDPADAGAGILGLCAR